MVLRKFNCNTQRCKKTISLLAAQCIDRYSLWHKLKKVRIHLVLRLISYQWLWGGRYISCASPLVYIRTSDEAILDSLLRYVCVLPAANKSRPGLWIAYQIELNYEMLNAMLFETKCFLCWHYFSLPCTKWERISKHRFFFTLYEEKN